MQTALNKSINSAVLYTTTTNNYSYDGRVPQHKQMLNPQRMQG
jgi:hypothetical protein